MKNSIISETKIIYLVYNNSAKQTANHYFLDINYLTIIQLVSAVSYGQAIYCIRYSSTKECLIVSSVVPDFIMHIHC